MAKLSKPVILCKRLDQTREQVLEYAQALARIAPQIGNHGLEVDEFWDAGIFRGAIEHLRGQHAASTTEKREFVELVLRHLQRLGTIRQWVFTGAGERYDYEVTFPGGRISVIETKGCLDGNNTNIYERPPQADEFVIWSLCQNATADPRHNAWSGLHTRLGSEIIHRRQLVDGVVIWDMLCNTLGRPCPKIGDDNQRVTMIDERKPVPPPCLFLLPRSVPDARNNPRPECHELEDVAFLRALWQSFKGDSTDITFLRIEVRMKGTNIQRRSEFIRNGEVVCVSSWTTIRRARP